MGSKHSCPVHVLTTVETGLKQNVLHSDFAKLSKEGPSVSKNIVGSLLDLVIDILNVTVVRAIVPSLDKQLKTGNGIIRNDCSRKCSHS